MQFADRVGIRLVSRNRTQVKPSPKDILLWEALGAVFVIFVGSAMHFLFGWTGGWRPVALIAAVNESIWEHLKLAFWPGLAWAFFPPKGYRLPLMARLAGRGFGLLFTAILIIAIFRGYTAILGQNLLLLDIGTFVLSVLLGQLACALSSMHAMACRGSLFLGLALLLLQIAAFASLTFFPPDHSLFVDSRDGLIGI